MNRDDETRADSDDRAHIFRSDAAQRSDLIATSSLTA
jgi:hypothetical protein